MSLKVSERVDGGREDVVTRLPCGGHQSHGSEKVRSQDLADVKNDVNQTDLSPEKSRSPIQKSEIGDFDSVQLKSSSKDEEASISVTSGLRHNLSTTLVFKEQAQGYKGEASEEDTFVDAKDDQGVGFIFPDSSSMRAEVVSHTSSKVKAPTSGKGKRFMPNVDFVDTDSQRIEKKRSMVELIREEHGNSHSDEEAEVGGPTKPFGMG
ncbi:hypothetical protein L1049_016275 [Liquidambar formosana]|uniref:Uncharacterized protein n=1 Tax=Liquidambar formosana TaxID=63359 RepID=A0AAP0S117_LIQFO